jgi:hypothetical protein
MVIRLDDNGINLLQWLPYLCYEQVSLVLVGCTELSAHTESIEIMKELGKG